MEAGFVFLCDAESSKLFYLGPVSSQSRELQKEHVVKQHLAPQHHGEYRVNKYTQNLLAGAWHIAVASQMFILVVIWGKDTCVQAPAKDNFCRPRLLEGAVFVYTRTCGFLGSFIPCLH